MKLSSRKSAQIDLRNAVRNDPQNAEAHFWLGRVALELGDPVAAEREAQAARDMGFRPLEGGDWQLDNRLHGTRYLVGNATRDDRIHEKLVHTYTVTVIADEHLPERERRSLPGRVFRRARW